MGTYDNPSADKFGPPPGQERFEAPTPRRGSQWIAGGVTLAILLARFQLDRMHKTGWMIPAILIGVPLADYLIRRSIRREREQSDPSIPYQNVPR